MPQTCVVPWCRVRASGHKFPAAKAEMKKWLEVIRRPTYKPARHSRVCRKHFTDDDYEMPKDSKLETPRLALKKGAIPSRFLWTEPSYKNRTCNDDDVESVFQDNIKKEFMDGDTVDQSQDTEIDVVQFVQVKMEEYEHTTSEIQCNLCTCKRRVFKYARKKYAKKVYVIERVIDTNSDAEVQFYTGFQSYNQIRYIMSLFGEEVFKMKYHPDMKSRPSRDLRPVHEFLLTVMKLYRNVLFTELAVQTKVTKPVLSNIFITWINYLYVKFKDINPWTPNTTEDSKAKVPNLENSCVLVIDSIEIKIEKPKNEAVLKSTYCTVQSCHILKVLVGISGTGCVVFVSEAFGGSLSNRELFIRSGLLDVLKPDSVILCNRKFDIQDLVYDKGIIVEMPMFLNEDQTQDSSPQTSADYAISNIEKTMKLYRTYRILNGILITKMVPIASRIIFICCMLANFRASNCSHDDDDESSEEDEEEDIM